MRVLVIAFGFLFGLLAAAGFLLPSFTVIVPQTTLQERVDETLPIQWGLLGAEASLAEATLAFHPDGTIGIAGVGSASGYALSADLALDARSRLRYDAGAFYLSDLSLDDIHLTLDNQSTAVVEERKSLLGALKDRAAEAIGKTDPDAVDAAKAEMDRLQDALLLRGKTALDSALTNTPLYDLNNAPGVLAWAPMAISDVQVQDGALAVTVSPSGFLGALARQAVALLFALLGAIAIVGSFLMPKPTR